MVKVMIHPTADVKSNKIGAGTTIWQFVVILEDAVIGDDCNICSHCFIENKVTIGNRVTVKAGVQIWDGLTIEDDVFIGPNVTFANDMYPRSKQFLPSPIATRIARGASVGAGATLLPGITVHANAMVGAGAVVTKSVPPNAIVVGNPARIVGYVGAEDGDTRAAANSTSVSKQVSRVHGAQLFELPKFSDIRGSLTAGEFLRTIPFSPKRYFIVFGVPSVETRGEHAHRTCEQFLICVKGTCSAVCDDGTTRQEFLLDRPEIGLHLSPMVWGIQYKYSADAVLLVFASEYYEAADYIRSYSEFVALKSR
jgi:acetyltransferase-like isoleucine patch superfamily enzyme